MNWLQLILLQLIAHVLADYFFQTEKLANEKNQNGFKSKFLLWHAVIVFACSTLLSLQPKFIVAALGIAATHYFIDGFKCKVLNQNNWFGKYWFFIDQLLHFAIIGIVVYLFSNNTESSPIVEFPIDERILGTILAYLVCLKPANIIIGEILKASKIESIQSITEKELPNAGKLIGITERVLSLTFILIGQFSAVGFLLAAKSILRYGEKDIHKTEYVLVGTLLSFAIAILLGVFVA